jgi:alpha/beta superfamily hydrolase
VGDLAARLKTQRGIVVEHQIVPLANHFFEDRIDPLVQAVGAYVDKRMAAKKDEAEAG